MIYAVIDTNVLVAALLSPHPDSATVQVVSAISNSGIRPLYNKEILTEYQYNKGTVLLLQIKVNYPKGCIYYPKPLHFQCIFTESRKKSEENCTKIWNKWRKVVNLRPKRWRKVARLSKNNVRKVVKPSPLDIE